MEVKINREIRNYTEAMFFGLSLRQFIFSVCACAVAVGLYFLLKPYVGTETVSWMCILGAAPFAALGFIKYNLVKNKKLDLVTSYVLWYENSQNPYETKRTAISEFIQRNSAEYIDIDKTDIIKSKAEGIMKTGIKVKDAYHVASAVCSSCDCFLTTDDRLLKYHTDEIQMLNSIDFIRRLEGDINGQ